MPEPKVQWKAFLAVTVCFGLFIWFSDALGPLSDSMTQHFVWIIVAYNALIWAAVILRKVWEFIRIRRVIIAFRSLSHDQQSAYLASLWPSGLRYEFLRRIDEDDRYEQNGSVARFPFPKAERRLHRIMAVGLGTATAGLALTVLRLRALPLPLRISAMVIAIMTALPTAWFIGRLTLLSSVLEVTPFGVHLSGLSMRTQRVMFAEPLELVNHPARGYCELRSLATGHRLRIHHARLGAEHALQLIWTHGGFEQAPAAPEAG